MAKKPLSKKAAQKPPKVIGADRKLKKEKLGIGTGSAPEKKLSVQKRYDPALTLMTELQGILRHFGIILMDPQETAGGLTAQSNPSRRHHGMVTIQAKDGQLTYGVSFPTEPDQQTATEAIVERKLREQAAFTLGITREGCSAKGVALQVAGNLCRRLTGYVVGRAGAPQIVTELDGRLMLWVYKATSGSLTF